jgi:hypothetical protein
MKGNVAVFLTFVLTSDLTSTVNLLLYIKNLQTLESKGKMWIGEISLTEIKRFEQFYLKYECNHIFIFVQVNVTVYIKV